LAEFALARFDQPGHGHQRRHVVALRGGNTTAEQGCARSIQRDDLDLGAAEINADAQHYTLPA